MAGAYRGIDPLFDYFGHAREVTGGSLGIEPVDVVADDRHAGMIATVRARRDDGREIDTAHVAVFRMGQDGLAHEFRDVSSDQETEDAFWA
jgi:hypothetical protein